MRLVDLLLSVGYEFAVPRIPSVRYNDAPGRTADEVAEHLRLMATTL